MKTNIIYATSNVGKNIEIGRFLGFYGLEATPFKDFTALIPEPEENGMTLGENAMIKARAYAEALSVSPVLSGQRAIIIADDTGVFMPALGDEPGIRVRRWAGYKMTDGEIVDYTLSRMKGLTGEQRAAQFRTLLCMMPIDEHGRLGTFTVFEGSLDGHIMEAASLLRIEGFPFESLFYAWDYRMLLGDLHRMDPAVKMGRRMFNHRERALEQAVAAIQKLL